MDAPRPEPVNYHARENERLEVSRYVGWRASEYGKAGMHPRLAYAEAAASMLTGIHRKHMHKDDTRTLLCMIAAISEHERTPAMRDVLSMEHPYPQQMVQLEVEEAIDDARAPLETGAWQLVLHPSPEQKRLAA